MKAAAIPTADGHSNEKIANTPASLTMQNVRLRSAIAWAYEVQTPQISGPESLDAGRYDIFAKTSSPVGDPQLRKMLQSLLADRFQLALHRNTREVQAYVLTLSRGGPKFKDASSDSASEITAGKRSATLRQTTIAQLTGHLADEFHAPVVDQTGLKGAYDFSLNIMPYITAEPKPEDIPSIVAQAMEDQLGLKLESRKTAVEILFVDHLGKVLVEN